MKKKAISRTRLNWLVDLGLLVAFVPLYFEGETGLSAHQLLGVFFGLGIGWHIFLHWKWVVSISKRLFKRQPRQVRHNYIVDWLAFLSLAGSLGTGLPIATWFYDKNGPACDVACERLYYNLLGWHSTLSYVFLGCVILHLWLHRKWIIKTTQRNVSFPQRMTAPAAALRVAVPWPQVAEFAERVAQFARSKSSGYAGQ